MFLNSNFNGRSSLMKPITIIIAILLIIGGIYFLFGKKDDTKNDEKAAQSMLKPSGLDKNKKIRDVGDVEEVLAKWVEANPEAIINSVANMQRKAMEDQAQNAQKNIGSKKNDLFNDKSSPTYSPNGYNVTIVEFFDYNCGYCKKVNPTIEALLKSDSKVRIIYKELPILGQLSEEMSVIALAVNIAEPSSYKKFHNALMNSHPQNKEEILKLARSNGVNGAKLDEILKSQKDKIMAIINANRSLAASIGINGTPGFVVGEELIPGAVDLATLQQKVSEQRKK